MKTLFFLIGVFCVQISFAQTYLINFTGTGESTTVNSVKVENLTTGNSLTMNGSDILRLNFTTGINSVDQLQSAELKIYPNPTTDYSILEIFPPRAGGATVSLFDMTGKTVAQTSSYLENSKQSFKLSGLKNGFYLVNVRGIDYQFSGKLLSSGKSDGIICLEKVNSIIKSAVDKQVKPDNKGTQATVDMVYTTGDRLKYTGISGVYSTVKTDIPVEDKTINFNFYACNDGDNYNYPVVQIGTQVWMAENLKSTKLNDRITPIPNIIGDVEWSASSIPAYCWYNNNESANSATYGALYNWYAASLGNLCPIGWHVPSDDEWTVLSEYLNENGYGYEGSGDDIAKSLASSSGWYKEDSPGLPYASAGSPGNDLASNNSSGFTARTGGNRFYSSVYNFSFGGGGEFAQWWSNTSFNTVYAWIRSLERIYPTLNRYEYQKNHGISVRCLIVMQLSTSAVSSITNTSALSGGNVTNDGGADITDHGVCWSKLQNPTLADNHTSDGSGSGSFSSRIIGLIPHTSYFVRSFATNITGTTYGEQVNFTTYNADAITDADGNYYNIVNIGTQSWMSENLKTTKYNDGTAIPLVIENNVWTGLSSPAYCWYLNDASTFKSVYGALYNWYAVDATSSNNKNVCPIGFHIPSDTEWTILTTYLGGASVAGGKLKEIGYEHWDIPNTGASNETAFTGLPGGYRGFNVGAWDYLKRYGIWWSSTEYYSSAAWYRDMDYNTSDMSGGTIGKSDGLSVRCIKD